MIGMLTGDRGPGETEIGVLLQDDTLAAQAALEKQLGAVGDDVEDISGKVAEVRCSTSVEPS